MNADEEFDREMRMKFGIGQIEEALGDQTKGQVQRAMRALRYAIAELHGTARAGVGEVHWPLPGAN